MSNENKVVVIIRDSYLIALCRGNFSQDMGGNLGTGEEASTQENLDRGRFI